MKFWVRLLSNVCVAVLFGVLLAAGGCGGDGSSGDSQEPTAAASFTVNGVTVVEDPAITAMLPAAIADTGIVRVITDCPFPPWEMWADEGASEVTGVDFDLVRSLCAVAGLEADVSVIPWDSALAAMQAKQYDVLVGAMFDTVEREEVLDMVQYAQDGSAIMVKAGNPLGIEGWRDLSGKKVVVQKGTIEHTKRVPEFNGKLRDLGLPEMDVAVLSGEAACQLAMKSGRAEAHILDGPLGAWSSKEVDGGSAFEMVTDAEFPEGYAPGPIAIGIRKDLRELTDAFAAALEKLINDGTYMKILEKYDMESAAVTEVVVNQPSQ